VYNLISYFSVWPWPRSRPGAPSLGLCLGLDRLASCNNFAEANVSKSKQSPLHDCHWNAKLSKWSRYLRAIYKVSTCIKLTSRDTLPKFLHLHALLKYQQKSQVVIFYTHPVLPKSFDHIYKWSVWRVNCTKYFSLLQLNFDNLYFAINTVAQQNTIWNNNNLTKLNYLSNIQLGRL